MSSIFKGSPYRRPNDLEAGSSRSAHSDDEDHESCADPFDITSTKNAPIDRLRRWRQAALVLNASRRFRYTLDLKKEEEKKQILRKIRAHAQAIRAAYLFKQAGEQVNGTTTPHPTPGSDFAFGPEQLASVTRDHNFNALQEYGGVNGLAESLKTNLQKGIPGDDSDLLKRRNAFGSNTYPRKKGRSFWRFVWEACQDLTLMILVVAAVASLALGIKTEGPKEGWYDGGSIAFAVFLVIIVTAISDYRQSLQFQKLDEEKRNIHLEVVRGGRRVEISIYDIVVGDIIPLNIGDQVPADGILISGHSLAIDESSMTGESDIVQKDAKQPFLMSGCKVADGSGTMLVTGDIIIIFVQFFPIFCRNYPISISNLLLHSRPLPLLPMEFEVRHVAGIEDCFVSLPLLLIQTLQSTRSSLLPPLLTLELRLPRASDDPWIVAWSGATSSSTAIEVSHQFAECISLPNHTTVQVRAASNLAKATLVTMEPDTEDDWEILELNSEHAEAAILKQVRIVYEGMRFPLWLHGRTIITFHVISTFPKKAVVQLVPGTEVAVAPKRRKKNLNNIESSTGESHCAKALLRLQDSDRRLFHKSNVKGVELGVALTSVAFIHQETAKRLSLESLQLVVIVPRLSAKESVKNLENDASRMKGSLTSKEVNSGISIDNKEFRQVVVRLLISDSVTKGHLMVTRSLRLYLRAGLHSWVYLKGYNAALKKEIPVLLLSPCHFKLVANDKAIGNGLEMLDGHKTHRSQNSLPISGSGTSLGVVNWSTHENVVAALSSELPCQEAEDCNHQDNKKGLECLLQAWFLAQLDAIASNAGTEVNTLILGSESLLHFQVTIYDSGTYGLVSSNGFSEKRNKTKNSPIEISYILTISEETLHSGQVNAYELSLDDRNKRVDVQGGVELFGKLTLGNPVSLCSVKDRTSVKGFSTDVSSLSWMGATASDVINRLMVLLAPSSGIWFSTYNLPFPGHVLIYGPAGSGKTLLARAVAKSLEEHEELLAHVIFVSCSGLSLEKAPTIRQALSSFISEALDHAPSVVVFDDLDSIMQSSSDSEGSQPSTSVVALTKFLTDIMDEFGEKRKSSCGIGPVAFIASVQSLESIPQSLSSSGRFDFHVQLPAPAASERGAILKHEIQRRSLQCHDDIIMDVASKCDGYDAYDLEILVDRAVHAAVGRFLPSDSGSEEHMNPMLVRDDFSHAMHEFLPVAMRDITKSAPDVGRSGWDDVGGLNDIRDAIKEMIELPSKFPNIFAKAPLRLRSNVLLYGPPGCGKTHIVGAAAAACSLRFISVKGPELLNKYIGASEQAVRDIFSKAAAAAPCLLFFDEFDSIAPKRGHDNTGVTDRVVNQFLTELDGVEVLTGVFVFAATSRPDLLDAALLRPGRLDRLLFCDFPSPQERLDILTVLSRKLPLASDVDLDAIAYMTEGFSGADLQALLSDAQLAAVHEHLSSANSNEPGKMPIITDTVLKSIASKARPSVSEAEKQRLYGIYSQFLDSKRSAAAQSRDAKGKRATLA